jgi:hypothetical protein
MGNWEKQAAGRSACSQPEKGLLEHGPRAEHHRLLLLATADEVNRMRQALQDPKEEDLDFLEWTSVVGSKAEVIAGQHRMQALEHYVRETGAPTTELWWSCDIYDRGESCCHLAKLVAGAKAPLANTCKVGYHRRY